MVRSLPIYVFCLFLLAKLALAKQFSIPVTENESPNDEIQGVDLLSEDIPTFNDKRIKDHSDKVLLTRIRAFFKTFTTGDFDGMRDLQAEDYTMTNIHFGVVRLSRDAWYKANQGLTDLVANLRVDALNLYGSSEPGQHSILEHITSMELKIDPPPNLIDAFPPGAKKGDTVRIANLNVLWWNEDGLITQEFEYGGLTWPGFSLGQWDPPTSTPQELR